MEAFNCASGYERGKVAQNRQKLQFCYHSFRALGGEMRRSSAWYIVRHANKTLKEVI
ncbi:hypothetical protein QG37_01800 [Candidozyma auris]|nr:hypothetical protein QG37_01800 [[Candida] auris]